MFNKAIVRIPCRTMENGITSAKLGKPNYLEAMIQHEAYISALEKAGLEVTILEPNERFPDSCFVEDTAVLNEKVAIIDRPGTISRQGEPHEVEIALRQFYSPHQLEKNFLLVAGEFINNVHFEGFHKIIVEEDEGYAANCLRINDYILLPSGFPKLKAALEPLPFRLIELEMSEFQKLDGGLSCLSLRF